MRFHGLMASTALPGALLACALAWTPVRAEGLEPPFTEIGIDQRIGEQVPIALTFRDERGEEVRLADYLGDRPAILTLAYYRCPMLCTLVLNGLTRGLRGMNLEVGRDFTLITVSIDPRETADLATAKKEIYLEEYGDPGAAGGWHFLTGDEASIKALAEAVGFRYVYDEETDQFAHAAGAMVLTPTGRLARYFYGIEYAPRDLRLALVEASAGRVGNVVDRLLLLCYQYDPATGRYGAMTLRLVRVGGVLTMIALATFVTVMLRREARHRREKGA